ncbi:hypothetical protein Salat_0562300 [Sesamum alatum]|uniref:CCHC-type domain-containing protein n=1 Tax=Sesamum alatum TaxID=300844 RepID=A0AAE1YQ86_9LAMI|nr:hypothetical protein Salat_0562300 [Sesamum alatum]
MADDMRNLKEALSVSEIERNSVMVPLGLWHGETETKGFFLVGRLLGCRSVNFEALKHTLMNVFNPIKGLDIRLIENGRFLFNFVHHLDRKRVMDNGPWAFEKNLLILRVLEEDDDPAAINLDWADFFVHVHGLSLGRMSRNMAEFIGNQIGKFRDIELNSGSQFWGSSLRIRVGLNVTQPLRRVLNLHTTMGAETTLTFTYERLPNFCYWCGCLGHILNLCEYQYDQGFDATQDPLPYGPWLRATTPAILRTRGPTTQHSCPYFATDPKPHAQPTLSRSTVIFNFTPAITSINPPHPPFPYPSTNSIPHSAVTAVPHTTPPPIHNKTQPLLLQPTLSNNQLTATVLSPHTSPPTLSTSFQNDSLIHPPPSVKH